VGLCHHGTHSAQSGIIPGKGTIHTHVPHLAPNPASSTYAEGGEPESMPAEAVL